MLLKVVLVLIFLKLENIFSKAKKLTLAIPTAMVENSLSAKDAQILLDHFPKLNSQIKKQKLS